MIHAQDPIQGVVHVKISPEEERKHVEGLMKSFEQALRDREELGLDKQAQTGVLQYHSSLDIEESDPQGSHLDMGSTRKLIEQAISRFMNPIFSRDQIALGKARFPQWVDFAKEVENLADWMLDRTRFRLFLEPFLKQAFVFPKAVAKVPFKRKLQKIKRPFYEVEVPPGQRANPKAFATREDEDGRVFERHWGLRNSNDKVVTITEMEETESGAWPEVIPWQDFIHPVPCADIYTAPWVCHRTFPGPDDIRRSIAAGVYRETVLDKDGKKIPLLKALGDPDSKPNMTMDISTAAIKEADSGGDTQAPVETGFFELLEFYTTRGDEEIIITVDRKTKTVCRNDENFYWEEVRPFVYWNYEATLNNVDGISLCFLLEPYHRALSCLFNQALDSGGMTGTMTFIDENTEAGRYFKDNIARAGVFTVSAAGKVSDAIAQFPLGSQINSVQYLIQVLQAEMRELASLTPYHSGIETIQRPTATGQVALIEEGKQPQYNRMDSLRTCLSSIVMMMLCRYRQFFPVDFEYYVQAQAPDRQELTYQVLKWPAESWRRLVTVEMKVSSEQMNRDLRKQAWTALVDKLPQVFEQLMGLAQMAMSPNPAALVARQMLEFQMKRIIQPWLEEFEVNGREDLDFASSIDTGTAIQQQFMQMQQQMEMLAAESQQKDTQLSEMARSLHHVFSQFVAATGNIPQPTPFGRSQASGPAEAAGGMGGGGGVPGGANAAALG